MKQGVALTFLILALAAVGFFVLRPASNNSQNRMPAGEEREYDLSNPDEIFNFLMSASQTRKVAGGSASEALLNSAQSRSAIDQDYLWRSSDFVGPLLIHLFKEGPHNNQKIVEILGKLDVWNTENHTSKILNLGESVASMSPSLTMHLKTLGFDITKVSKDKLAHMRGLAVFEEQPGLFESVFEEALNPPSLDEIAKAGEESYMLGEKPADPGLCGAKNKFSELGGETFKRCQESLCGSPSEATQFCQFIFDFGDQTFAEKVSVAQKKSSEPLQIEDYKSMQSCGIKLKLQVFDGKAKVRRGRQKLKPTHSTVRFDRRFLNFKDGKIQRTYDGGFTEEMDYGQFVKFASSFCSDKVIEKRISAGNGDGAAVTRHYFNDYRGALSSTIGDRGDGLPARDADREAIK